MTKAEARAIRASLVVAINAAQREYFAGNKSAGTVVMALRWVLGAEVDLVETDPDLHRGAERAKVVADANERANS